MKTLRLISVGLMAVLMCVNFTACDPDPDPEEPDYKVDPEIESLSSKLFNTCWELDRKEFYYNGKYSETDRPSSSFVLCFSDEIFSDNRYTLKIKGSKFKDYWYVDENGLTYSAYNYNSCILKNEYDFMFNGGSCYGGIIKKLSYDELVIEYNGDLIYFERSYYSFKDYDDDYYNGTEDDDNSNDDYYDDEEDEEKWWECLYCKGEGLCHACSGDGVIGNRNCTFCDGSGICDHCDGRGVIMNKLLNLSSCMFKRYLIVLFSILLIVSCDNGEVEKLTAERDSLQLICNKSENDLKELNTLVSDIASSLDSIAITENVLYTDKDKDGVLLDKKQILENLEEFGKILERQKQRIALLEDSLQSAEPNKWNIIISSIRKNLEEKEIQIKSLKEELESKNKDIRSLRGRLQKSQSDFNSVKEQNDALQNAIQAQDEVINEGFVRIGTKKELQSAGLLKGGFLSKKKVNYDKVDRSTFNSVDIRMFKVVELNSNNPKILTPQSSGNSYHFEKKGNNVTVLYIDDPTTFWSVSNYLIIQL